MSIPTVQELAQLLDTAFLYLQEYREYSYDQQDNEGKGGKYWQDRMTAEQLEKQIELTTLRVRDGYNGWTNYETWLVNLWLDNDPGTQDWVANLAKQEQRHHLNATVYETHEGRLAETLKDEVTENCLPDLGSSLAADLLGAAVSEVNWREIASALLENYAEDDEDTDQDDED